MLPLTPIERRTFDHTALEEAMARLDGVVRSSRHALHVIAGGAHKSAADNSDDLLTSLGGAEPASAC
jgi:hypothetical protein